MIHNQPVPANSQSTVFPPDTDFTTTGQTSKDWVVWSKSQQHIMIDYIVENWSKVADGMSFAKSFWVEVELLLSKSPFIKCTNQLIAALITNSSGIHWDSETGLSITEESKTQWTDYVKCNPTVTGFKNKGWPYFKKLDTVMSGHAARGVHAFCTPRAASSIHFYQPSIPSTTLQVQTPPKLISVAAEVLCTPAAPAQSSTVSGWLVALPSPSSLPAPLATSPISSAVLVLSSKGKHKAAASWVIPPTINFSISPRDFQCHICQHITYVKNPALDDCKCTLWNAGSTHQH
ncbi:hypothetical protein SERLA73DRAFT_151498 [Serpula lacrymans var. lacrymans S7.3]|uniref:Myb/SANT-like domain-containing protein n=2 Tax=Serpula lacrymans var. lacrymans TaxID=341189 RepID=F8PT32_SERL3|nr:uncharacterized protein SERLADRAFT_407257 [Serpula lacrymans var. lacrymans S7.9]EGO00862.1 hypothetical protein SERLA73DRAFT_151498 [Serpula lacrymans var. lacrymans S7.3]EGO26482.1 hypothetical protein SERLADRAFT_407257 [Serpula lacrymans var. lacrymans S7.9]